MLRVHWHHQDVGTVQGFLGCSMQGCSGRVFVGVGGTDLEVPGHSVLGALASHLELNSIGLVFSGMLLTVLS